MHVTPNTKRNWTLTTANNSFDATLMSLSASALDAYCVGTLRNTGYPPLWCLKLVNKWDYSKITHKIWNHNVIVIYKT